MGSGRWSHTIEFPQEQKGFLTLSGTFDLKLLTPFKNKMREMPAGLKMLLPLNPQDSMTTGSGHEKLV